MFEKFVLFGILVQKVNLKLRGFLLFIEILLNLINYMGQISMYFFVGYFEPFVGYLEPLEGYLEPL